MTKKIEDTNKMNKREERLRVEGILIAADSIIETFKEIPPNKFNKELAIAIIRVLANKFKQDIGE